MAALALPAAAVAALALVNKVPDAVDGLVEGQHRDGIRRLNNRGVPSINAQLVRSIKHVGWGFNTLNWDEARNWMLEDKANRIVETIQGLVYSTQVLWERKDKTKPMQLGPKATPKLNWLNFYPQAQFRENLARWANAQAMLRELGMEEYVPLFEEQEMTSMKLLRDIAARDGADKVLEDMFKEMGIKKMGHRQTIVNAVLGLRQ